MLLVRIMMMMMMQNEVSFLYNVMLLINSHVFCICSVLPEDGQFGRNVLQRLLIVKRVLVVIYALL